MDRNRSLPISKDDVITVEDDEIFEGDNFKWTLAGKIWTDSPNNICAFKQTIIQTWRLKNSMQIQELNMNINFPVQVHYEEGG